MPFTLAIVGRPNVGKSTLFNRLTGRRQALVDDRPGVTRDRREGKAEIGGREITVVDTPGFEEARGDSIEARMRRQTEEAIAAADAAVFLVDARAGITPLDRAFADLLRRSKRPVLLVGNKCEGSAHRAGLAEAFGLGLGEPVAVSAEHGEGIAEILDWVGSHLPELQESRPDEEGESEEDETVKPVRLAVVGRPNVGKSTLVNRLIGQERQLTGPEPGITRDAITIPWSYKAREIELVDTAGLRKRPRIEDRVEKLAVGDTLNTIRYAEVVILVLDGEAVFDKQDLTIARHVVEEGRALVVAVSKWDAVADKTAALKRLKDRLEASLHQARGVAWIAVSGLKGSNVDKLMDAVLAAHERWNRRLPTSQLNRWLGEAVERHTPPLVQGRRLKIRYATQVKARPPTFALWVTNIDALPESYERYLAGSLREVFDLGGVPIRFLLRKGKNPYARED
ncbi:MAG: ribosome biogenesis GTPase Der [Alphaproteobacteria bacterium]|nr:ribosome biogenesis GTPase Der [Alphaproteobacteria bacterium]